ncbi:MAG: geranylgeranyl reductase family protein [Nitrospirae bacterium]|nr:geranylgeranyl reductase family protein [Nitrospirota bacterium]
MLRTKALIIGGGPAGATAARFLAGSGAEAILVERDLSYVKPCGGGIPSTALEELGIPEEKVTKRKITKMRIVSPKGESVEVVMKGGHLCITERGEFDSHLREAAKDKGASILEAEFIRFNDIGKNIISTVRKKSTGEEITIKSDYVVAADGITSRTASGVKSPNCGSLYTISAYIKPTPSPSSPPTRGGEIALVPSPLMGEGDDACEFWFGSNHASNFYSWIFPSQGYSSIGTGSKDAKELSTFLDRFIKRRFGVPLKDFAPLNFSKKTRAFRIPLWEGNLFNIKNILFAGDVAGMVMPITYEGIYYAMKSGEFAARSIIEGKPDIYKKLWKSRFKTRFLLMSKIRNYLFKDDENIEKFVALHKRPEVQEIAMRLWLKKEAGSGSLISYLNFFRHFLKI